MKYVIMMMLASVLMIGNVYAADKEPADGLAIEQIKATWALPDGPSTDFEGFKLYQEGVDNPIATVPADTFGAIVDAPADCSTWYVRTYEGNKISNESEKTEWCQPNTIDPTLPVPEGLDVVEIVLK